MIEVAFPLVVSCYFSVLNVEMQFGRDMAAEGVSPGIDNVTASMVGGRNVVRDADWRRPTVEECC